jgi:GT2 family glycosyltransferase
MVSIVIPNYNGRELLERYLPSVILASLHFSKVYAHPTEIIVVDDASKDSSLEYLYRVQKESRVSDLFRFRIEEHQKNKGFSDAMNTGIKASMYPVIVSLNTDVKVSKNFLYPLVRHFESDSNIFSVKCRSTLPDGTNESVKKIRINKGLVEPVLEINPPSRNVEIIYADAGSCAYSAQKIKQLGGFDTLYAPFYFEDFDLGYRAIKRGWFNIYEPLSVVYHEHNQSVKKVVKNMNANPIFVRNRELFNIKNIHLQDLRYKADRYRYLRFIKSIFTFNKATFKGVLMTFRDSADAIESHNLDKKFEIITDEEILAKFLK